MFYGNHIHTIDAKGRLSIPAKYRDIILRNYGGQLIVSKDPEDRCIVVYTPEGWENEKVKIRRLPSMAEEVKAFRRRFFFEAEDCNLDKQGRILIPPRLREYASLTREVLVIGQDDKIEIWSPELWGEVDAAYDSKTLTKKMAELGM